MILAVNDPSTEVINHDDGDDDDGDDDDDDSRFPHDIA